MNSQIEAREIMTRALITGRPNEPLTELKQKLDINRIHHLPIVEDGHVVGMISKGDLLRMEHYLTLFGAKKAIESNKIVFSAMLAHEVMSTHVILLRENDKVMTAVDIFRENLFHALPVIDTDHKLVGIVTPMDLLTYAFQDEKLIAS